jgi:hypothetical protein
MADPEHLKILAQGVEAWNRWRYVNLVVKPNLSKSRIHGVFRDANFCDVDFRAAHLKDLDLCGADFTEARLGSTSFGDNDLRQVKGLESVRHHAPSTIGIDTIDRSQGTIPELFLRGCGLNDWRVETAKLHNPALSTEEVTSILYKIHGIRAHQAIQINPLFTSYTHRACTKIRLLTQDSGDSTAVTLNIKC